jgi:hypothetical protein
MARICWSLLLLLLASSRRASATEITIDDFESPTSPARESGAESVTDDLVLMRSIVGGPADLGHRMGLQLDVVRKRRRSKRACDPGQVCRTRDPDGVGGRLSRARVLRRSRRRHRPHERRGQLRSVTERLHRQAGDGRVANDHGDRPRAHVHWFHRSRADHRARDALRRRGRRGLGGLARCAGLTSAAVHDAGTDGDTPASAQSGCELGSNSSRSSTAGFALLALVVALGGRWRQSRPGRAFS